MGTPQRLRLSLCMPHLEPEKSDILSHQAVWQRIYRPREQQAVTSSRSHFRGRGWNAQQAVSRLASREAGPWQRH